MQQRDDRQQGPRRPSLFTEEPAVPTEDTGILSQLDGKTAAPARTSGGSRKAGKIAGGLLGLGVVAGALVWAFGYSDEPDPVTAQAAVQPVPPQPAPVLAVANPAVTPAQAAGLPAAQTTPAPDEREVSAATILDGTTAADASAQQGEDPARSLSHALEAPSKPAPKDELSAAFDRPAEPARKHADKHPAKSHDKAGEKAADKAAAKDKHKVEAARKERAEKRHATQEAAAHTAKKRIARAGGAKTDNDVALLEALISHTRPADKGAVKKPARATPCAPAEGSGEGATGASDCKPPSAAKAAG